MSELTEDEADEIIKKAREPSTAERIAYIYTKEDLIALADRLNVTLSRGDTQKVDIAYKIIGNDNYEFSEIRKLMNNLVQKEKPIDPNEKATLINIRVDSSFKQKLVDKAKEDNITLTQLILNMLNGNTVTLKNEIPVDNSDAKFLAEGLIFFFKLFNENAANINLSNPDVQKKQLKEYMKKAMEVSKK